MKTVRILCLEDNKFDAELISEVLEAMPIRPKVEVVDSGVAYREKISNNRYDLILSDYSLPGFNGITALELARSLAPDTPFIFFSGTIGEDVAVDSLLQGATDYVVKQRPARLPAAITRALEISELKRRQRASQDSLRFQADILSNVTDAVVATDLEGRVVYWNPAAEQIFKRTAKSVMMKPLGEVGLDVVPGSLSNLLKRVQTEGKARETLACIRQDSSSPLWILASARNLVYSSDRPLGFLLILSDVTDGKLREDEVFKLNAELEERVQSRTAALAEVNADLERFGYSVSHDLGAPIRAVAGYANILAEDHAEQLGAEGLQTVSRIISAAARMDRICKGLLRLARLSASPTDFRKIDLTNMARLVVAELKDSDSARNVEFTVEEGLMIQGDELLLRSLLENLVGNAWKFTSGRTKARIEIGKEKTGRGQAFFVRDNGIGFDEADAKSLFEPFLRLHGEDDYPGSGIGLSTAARIAERHHGEMWAVGKKEEGATFYFTLQASTGSN